MHLQDGVHTIEANFHHQHRQLPASSQKMSHMTLPESSTLTSVRPTPAPPPPSFPHDIANAPLLQAVIVVDEVSLRCLPAASRPFTPPRACPGNAWTTVNSDYCCPSFRSLAHSCSHTVQVLVGLTCPRPSRWREAMLGASSTVNTLVGTLHRGPADRLAVMQPAGDN